MLARKVLMAATGTLSIAIWGCCCTSWLPSTAQPSDEPDIERTAREYAQQHAQELAGATDAGTPGQCSASSIATAVAAGIVTRGSAGSDAAGQVAYSLVDCAGRLLLYVVKRAAGWVVVGAALYNSNDYLINEIGERVDFTAADSDNDVDELF
jgi:hypothetical protein